MIDFMGRESNKCIKEILMPAKFTVYKARARRYHFDPNTANGEIIASGETCPDKKPVLIGIDCTQTNAAITKIIDDTGEAAAPRGRKPAAAAAETPKPRNRKPKTE
jgi:uncharacterized protein YegP (UPF0339 family)